MTSTDFVTERDAMGLLVRHINAQEEHEHIRRDKFVGADVLLEAAALLHPQHIHNALCPRLSLDL